MTHPCKAILPRRQVNVALSPLKAQNKSTYLGITIGKYLTQRFTIATQCIPLEFQFGQLFSFNSLITSSVNAFAVLVTHLYIYIYILIIFYLINFLPVLGYSHQGHIILD